MLPSLVPDCSRCSGICCAALPFSASSDFAFSKPAGKPCLHLGADSRCAIHARLRQEGFTGCAVFDCFGAGQRVASETFGGRSWRESPELARQTFAAFRAVWALHELLWYLSEALLLPKAASLREALLAAQQQTASLAGGSPDQIAEIDIEAQRQSVNALLLQASALEREGLGGPDMRRADKLGADLRRTKLKGASLRGALLVGADLRGVDLDCADLTGADLRGADLRGADLSGSLFLLQAQLVSARGDTHTRIPHARARPTHWG